MTSARLVDGGLSEAAFQAQVLGLAAFYGWRAYHPPDNKPRADARGRAARQRVEPGFPDLVMVRRDGRAAELIFAELKAERGRLGPGQAEWAEDLGAVSAGVAALTRECVGAELAHVGPIPRVEVYLWRPSDWPAIERRLAAGRARQPVVGRPFDED